MLERGNDHYLEEYNRRKGIENGDEHDKVEEPWLEQKRGHFGVDVNGQDDHTFAKASLWDVPGYTPAWGFGLIPENTGFGYDLESFMVAAGRHRSSYFDPGTIITEIVMEPLRPVEFVEMKVVI